MGWSELVVCAALMLDKEGRQWYSGFNQAEVAELADAPRSGRGGYQIHEGSNPSLGTRRSPS